jgi:hypothetical protein
MQQRTPLDTVSGMYMRLIVTSVGVLRSSSSPSPSLPIAPEPHVYSLCSVSTTATCVGPQLSDTTRCGGGPN